MAVHEAAGESINPNDVVVVAKPTLAGFTRDGVGKVPLPQGDAYPVIRIDSDRAELRTKTYGTLFVPRAAVQSVAEWSKGLGSEAGLSPTKLVERGNIFTALEDYRAAITDYSAALRKDATLSAAMLGRGRARLRYAQQNVPVPVVVASPTLEDDVKAYFEVLKDLGVESTSAGGTNVVTPCKLVADILTVLNAANGVPDVASAPQAEPQRGSDTFKAALKEHAESRLKWAGEGPGNAVAPPSAEAGKAVPAAKPATEKPAAEAGAAPKKTEPRTDLNKDMVKAFAKYTDAAVKYRAAVTKPWTDIAADVKAKIAPIIEPTNADLKANLAAVDTNRAALTKKSDELAGRCAQRFAAATKQHDEILKPTTGPLPTAAETLPIREAYATLEKAADSARLSLGNAAAGKSPLTTFATAIDVYAAARGKFDTAVADFTVATAKLKAGCDLLDTQYKTFVEAVDADARAEISQANAALARVGPATIKFVEQDVVAFLKTTESWVAAAATFKQAVADYRAALQAFQTAIQSVAKFAVDDLKNFKAALETFDAAVKKYPHKPMAKSPPAGPAEPSLNSDDAITMSADLRQSLRWDPQPRPEVHFLIGEVERLSGNLASAFLAFDRAYAGLPDPAWKELTERRAQNVKSAKN